MSAIPAVLAMHIARQREIAKKHSKEEKDLKNRKDIRYFTEKYINGIEKGQLQIETINKVNENDIKEAYGINNYMMKRYKKIRNLFENKV